GVIDLERWIDQGLPDGFRLSVNLPPRYVSRSGRVERLTELLRNAPCERLTAEVTETSVVDDLDLAARRLAELRSFGMTVVLDDFGTGSASLTLLQRVPLDGVKIDRSFVKNIATDTRDRALVGGFIQLASTINLEVTAEGIEDPAQVKALLALGCPRQQGYLHGTAMTADELYIALPMRPKRGARSGA
ncbi:MAG TPA: EAL domain-containing protein, partial [Ilumatobacter sp.]